MRSLVQTLVRWLAEALVRLYYPRRSIEGSERIPEGQPVVFVLNHPNGLLDPLVLRVASGRAVRFLAKSTLFANPASRLAMEAFGSMPVYRAHESGGRATDPSRNDETFARCRQALAQREALALFPEGVSHSEPELKPLKTGAARIALSAAAEMTGASAPASGGIGVEGAVPLGLDVAGVVPLGVSVVPIGLHYEHKAQFRSAMLLVVGEPIEMASRLEAYRSDERATVDTLTDDIRTRLDEVVLQAESRELLEGIARVAAWTGDTDPHDLAAHHRRAQELLAAYRTLRQSDPARVDAIAADARAYARTLRHLGVKDPWGLEIERIRPSKIAGAIATLVLAAPLAALGAVMGWAPYRLAGMVAKRTAKGDEDILGTVKLIGGALFLFVAWAAEATGVGVRFGPMWAAPTFAIGVASGYVALLFGELVDDTREALRYLWLRAFYHDLARRLFDRRRALAAAVTRALGQVA